MSESAVGFSVTATRQNAGRFAIVALGLVAPGGVKLPVTTAALVTVPSAMDSYFKLSHYCGVCAYSGVAHRNRASAGQQFRVVMDDPQL